MNTPNMSLVTEVSSYFPEALQDDKFAEHYASLCHIVGGPACIAAMMIDGQASGPILADISRTLNNPSDAVAQPADQAALDQNLSRQIRATQLSLDAALRLSDTLHGRRGRSGRAGPWDPTQVLPAALTDQQQGMVGRAQQLFDTSPVIPPDQLRQMDPTIHLDWLESATRAFKERRVMVQAILAQITLNATIALPNTVDRKHGTTIRAMASELVGAWQNQLTFAEGQATPEDFAEEQGALVRDIVTTGQPFFEGLYDQYNAFFITSLSRRLGLARNAIFGWTVANLAQAECQAETEVGFRLSLLKHVKNLDLAFQHEEPLMPHVVDALSAASLENQVNGDHVLEKEAQLYEHIEGLEKMIKVRQAARSSFLQASPAPPKGSKRTIGSSPPPRPTRGFDASRGVDLTGQPFKPLAMQAERELYSLLTIYDPSAPKELDLLTPDELEIVRHNLRQKPGRLSLLDLRLELPFSSAEPIVDAEIADLRFYGRGTRNNLVARLTRHEQLESERRRIILFINDEFNREILPEDAIYKAAFFVELGHANQPGKKATILDTLSPFLVDRLTLRPLEFSLDFSEQS
jgi:hypothetical protein